MADVRPFPAIRYNPEKIADLSAVITQPYDKITPQLQATYLARHRFNFVRLILPGGDRPYENSARTCTEWLNQGVLIEDPTPAFYVLEEEFSLDGKTIRRRGFIGAVRVEEFEKGTILPHEFTHSGPKADRLNLLRATEKDYEQIFLLYPDEAGEIDPLLTTRNAPLLQVTDDYGVIHRLWRIAEPDRLRAISQALQNRVLLIADGHHRYETALNYLQEMEKKKEVPENAALRFKTAACFKITDPGLVILPTHRLLRGTSLSPDEALNRLAEYFVVKPVADAQAKTELAAHQKHAYVLYYGPGKSYLLRLKSPTVIDILQDRSPRYRELDVALLHALVIDRVFGIKPDQVEAKIGYERYWEDTFARVNSGEYQLALFLNPTRPEQVQALAQQRERMPQKSTDFYPKLVSGLVFMDVSASRMLSA
ncbi:MAG: DUF1015 domain-containing protein [candidate division WOR-3 bacterium]|jgi:uncharacterized protein (DUF1015 family)